METSVLEKSDDSLEEIREKIVRFVKLRKDEDRFLDIKDRVEYFGGVARVFVHPLFEEYPGYRWDKESEIISRRDHPDYQYFHESFPDRQDKREQVKGLFLDLLRKDSNTTPPIFLFEEEDHIESLIQVLNKEVGSEMRNEIILIATRAGSGVVSDDKKGITENLRALKIGSFLVAGNYLEINQEGRTKHDGRYGLCVGDVIKFLSTISNANVNLSALTYPHGRMDDNKYL